MEAAFTLNQIEHRLSADFCLTVQRLELQQGKIHLLTGANGAGKSTLLKILACLIQPQQGSMVFFDQPVSAFRSEQQLLRRQITLVEQAPYLFSGTVFSNLAYGLKIRGIKCSAQHRRIATVLEQVGLPSFSDRQVTELSGGEVQRVALARALVLNPVVLLLDEPTANIDHASLPEFEQLLQQLVAGGTTVVMSTHDPAQAERVAGNFISLENGVVGG